MGTRLSLLGFEPRRVSLFVSFATPCKLAMMNSLVRAIILDTFYPLNSAHTYYMTLFPTVFTLWYSRIHISTMTCGDKTPTIESSINKTSCFWATLSVPDINPDNSHVQLGRYFDYSWFRGQNNVIEYMIFLKNFSISSEVISELVCSERYGILMILRYNLDWVSLRDSICSALINCAFLTYFSMDWRSKRLATLLVKMTTPLFLTWIKSAIISNLTFLRALLMLAMWTLESLTNLLALSVLIWIMTCLYEGLFVVILIQGFSLPLTLMIFWTSLIFLF